MTEQETDPSPKTLRRRAWKKKPVEVRKRREAAKRAKQARKKNRN